ncbi:hypothetical protein M378DRAFT_18561 [Amanita muscaria Koide BX008]|uniref:Uncharacterized protein n=1 Tax=Amanita muscaria (strain Koide BX008) TaxID=946122 RepID=A0A0C2W0Y0_AMAMK|nr:hypothetical protein M378DRAFT_18561 [Amanita muscaria Koide BX008]
MAGEVSLDPLMTGMILDSGESDSDFGMGSASDEESYLDEESYIDEDSEEPHSFENPSSESHWESDPDVGLDSHSGEESDPGDDTDKDKRRWQERALQLDVLCIFLAIFEFFRPPTLEGSIPAIPDKKLGCQADSLDQFRKGLWNSYCPVVQVLKISSFSPSDNASKPQM